MPSRDAQDAPMTEGGRPEPAREIRARLTRDVTPATFMTQEYQVSGGYDSTLQSFDFFYQWYETALTRYGVDGTVLKNLILAYVSEKAIPTNPL